MAGFGSKPKSWLRGGGDACVCVSVQPSSWVGQAWQVVREVSGLVGGIGIMALVTQLEGGEGHHH